MNCIFSGVSAATYWCVRSEGRRVLGKRYSAQYLLWVADEDVGWLLFLRFSPRWSWWIASSCTAPTQCNSNGGVWAAIFFYQTTTMEQWILGYVGGFLKEAFLSKKISKALGQIYSTEYSPNENILRNVCKGAGIWFYVSHIRRNSLCWLFL